MTGLGPSTNTFSAQMTNFYVEQRSLESKVQGKTVGAIRGRKSSVSADC